jgi:hypothetical protein
MNMIEFKSALLNQEPPTNCPNVIKALWYLHHDQWDDAHDIAQNDSSPHGSWLHGILHKVEGDEWNAKYWYQKAGMPYREIPLNEEIKLLADQILSES